MLTLAHKGQNGQWKYTVIKFLTLSVKVDLYCVNSAKLELYSPEYLSLYSSKLA